MAIGLKYSVRVGICIFLTAVFFWFVYELYKEIYHNRKKNKYENKQQTFLGAVFISFVILVLLIIYIMNAMTSYQVYDPSSLLKWKGESL